MVAQRIFRELRLLWVHDTVALPLRNGKNKPDRASECVLKDNIGAGHVSSKPLWRAP